MNKCDIGGGWTTSDFTYSKNEVVGFSKTGKEKAKTNKNLVIPDHYYDGFNSDLSNRVEVKSIGPIAFKLWKLDSVIIPEGIEEIKGSAFE